MTITITHGIRAALRPANTSEAELVEFGAAEEFIGVLRVCNQETATTRTYSIAHTDAAGAAAGEDWIESARSIGPGQSMEYSIFAGNAESIRVVASVADKISFHLTGKKKVVS